MTSSIKKVKKKKMKFSILAFIAIASFIAGSKSDNAYEGCVIVNESGVCECFERRVLYNGKGCGPKLPKSNKCSIYSIELATRTKRNFCSICKPGFALKVETTPGVTLGGFKTTCVRGTIQNCLIETVTRSKRHGCSGCSGGLYSNKFECKKISKPVPNCMWGATGSGVTKATL